MADKKNYNKPKKQEKNAIEELQRLALYFVVFWGAGISLFLIVLIILTYLGV